MWEPLVAESTGGLRGWLPSHELVLPVLRLCLVGWIGTVLRLAQAGLIGHESAICCLVLLHLDQLLLHHELLLHRHLLKHFLLGVERVWLEATGLWSRLRLLLFLLLLLGIEVCNIKRVKGGLLGFLLRLEVYA